PGVALGRGTREAGSRGQGPRGAAAVPGLVPTPCASHAARGALPRDSPVAGPSHVGAEGRRQVAPTAPASPPRSPPTPPPCTGTPPRTPPGTRGRSRAG